MRQNELPSFLKPIKCLHIGDDSIDLHRGQVLLLLNLETSLSLDQAELVSQVLVLDCDLEVGGKGLLVLLLQSE